MGDNVNAAEETNRSGPYRFFIELEFELEIELESPKSEISYRLRAGKSSQGPFNQRLSARAIPATHSTRTPNQTKCSGAIAAGVPRTDETATPARFPASTPAPA